MPDFFLFLAALRLVIEGFKAYRKASCIFQLLTLSVLNLRGNQCEIYCVSLRLVLRGFLITDRGLANISRGFKHYTALHTIILNFEL